MRRRTWLAAGIATLAAAPAITLAQNTIREATGADATAIQAAVDAFRNDLGTLNPNQAGSMGAGRREINWDGVPDGDSSPARFAGDFFNTVSPRGVVFGPVNTLFQVSTDAVNPSNTPVEFGNLNVTYPTAFATFSAERLFGLLNSNTVEILFFVPGSSLPATVTGFGAVFTDVDEADSTSIAYFDADGNLLLERNVLATAGDASLSFLGVSWEEPIVARVVITCGDRALGSLDVTQAGPDDIVAMDDFIYGEPIVITPKLSINDVAVNEGNAGTTTARFTVTLSVVTDQTVTVTYTTDDGTAQAGSDFQTASGTLTFQPGETRKTIEVLVNGDTHGEADETFSVLLSNASNATLDQAEGIGTILDDDGGLPDDHDHPTVPPCGFGALQAVPATMMMLFALSLISRGRRHG